MNSWLSLSILAFFLSALSVQASTTDGTVAKATKKFFSKLPKDCKSLVATGKLSLKSVDGFDCLFKAKSSKSFSASRVAKLVALLFEAGEDKTAVEITKMWVKGRGWNAQSQSLIKEDLEDVLSTMDRKVDIYNKNGEASDESGDAEKTEVKPKGTSDSFRLRVFNHLVTAGKSEISPGSQWADVLLEALNKSAVVDKKNEKGAPELKQTVEFFFNIFLDCSAQNNKAWKIQTAAKVWRHFLESGEYSSSASTDDSPSTQEWRLYQEHVVAILKANFDYDAPETFDFSNDSATETDVDSGKQRKHGKDSGKKKSRKSKGAAGSDVSTSKVSSTTSFSSMANFWWMVGLGSVVVGCIFFLSAHFVSKARKTRGSSI